MPASPTSGQNRPLRRGDPISARGLNRVADALWRNLQAPTSAPGGSFPGGSFTFPPLALPGSGAPAKTIYPPLYPFLTKDGMGNFVGNFWPGTVAGILPTNIRSALALTQSQTNYAYAAMTASGANITGAAVTISTTYPTLAAATASNPPTAFNIPLAIFDLATAGSEVALNVAGFGNIWVSPMAFLFDTINTGSLLTAPFTPWYNWIWGGDGD